MKLLTIIGARPQIIKAAALSRAVAAWNASHDAAHQVEEVLLHTGQHYDDNMSAVFFRELGIPEPDINLHVGSGTHGVQTARMIEGIEGVLQRAESRAQSAESTLALLQSADNTDNAAKGVRPFDGVVLYGDTNSTLAGAIAAAKLHVPVFHIEAGLRSWNMQMPEEINRIVADQLSSVLFAPTQTGMQNLQKAGIAADGREQVADGRVQMAKVEGKEEKPIAIADSHSRQYAVLAGDVMYDNSMHFAPMAEQRSDIIERLGLTPKQFVLATIHRPANTDSAERLSAIFRAILQVAEGREQMAECREQSAEGMKVVLPLHPRTRKLLPEKLPAELLQRVEQCANILITEPASFFDIIRLEKHARLVLTDSGGVQKEAFFFETPCVILRDETEWVEIVEAGAGILAGADYDRILAAYQALADKPVHFPPLFGDAHAAERILREIVAYLG